MCHINVVKQTLRFPNMFVKFYFNCEKLSTPSMNPDCKMVFLSKRLSSHLYFMGNKYICHRYIWCIESSFLTNPLYLLLHISHLCCSKSFSKHFRNFCQNGHKTGGCGVSERLQLYIYFLCHY